MVRLTGRQAWRSLNSTKNKDRFLGGFAMMQSRKLALAVMLGIAAVLPASAQNNPKVAWNLSVWGPPRAFTAGIETLAKYVEKESGGNFTIKIHYGEALSKGPDNLDNIKLAAFEMAQI